jgi:hypothetical protein
MQETKNLLAKHSRPVLPYDHELLLFESSFLYFPDCVTLFKRFCRARLVSYSQDFFWPHAT